MPALLYQGREAQEVADFVAAVHATWRAGQSVSILPGPVRGADPQQWAQATLTRFAGLGARTIVSHGAEHVATWPLRPGRLSIGRAADNEVQLEARYVSRHHCQVVTVGNLSTVEDLGSVNGLCVNGTVVKHHVLQHADRITLGEHALTYLMT